MSRTEPEPLRTEEDPRTTGPTQHDIELAGDAGEAPPVVYERNKWGIAVCAVGIHLSIGSVYAYSVMKKPLMEAHGWTALEMTSSFAIASSVIGMVAATLGPYVEIYGPRRAGTFAGIAYGVGFVIAGFACEIKSIWLFNFGYGVIGGLGRGVGYITPVSTLIRYFPERRGLATGMAIMGFGFGALLYSPIMGWMLEQWKPAVLFWALGVWYAFWMVLLSQYLLKPKVPIVQKKQAEKNRVGIVGDMLMKAAVRKREFWLVWTMMYLNIVCGIAVISAASPLLQDSLQIDPTTAAAIVGLMGLFNGLGRISWSTASDKLGRTNTYRTIFVLQVGAFFAIPSATSLELFAFLLFLIMTCYGAGFAMLPAYLGDLFGFREVDAILGVALTAWSAAGLTGPLVFSALETATGETATALYAFGAVMVLATAVNLVMTGRLYKLQKAPPVDAAAPGPKVARKA